MGTGAGIPGVPLAILNPQIQWELCDNHHKKMTFLRMALYQLQISNIELFECRIESHQPTKPYPCIISRAFSSIENVIEMTEHVCCPQNGRFIFLKGDHYQQELAKLPAGWELESLEQLTIPEMDDKTRYILVIKREEK